MTSRTPQLYADEHGLTMTAMELHFTRYLGTRQARHVDNCVAATGEYRAGSSLSTPPTFNLVQPNWFCFKCDGGSCVV